MKYLYLLVLDIFADYIYLTLAMSAPSGSIKHFKNVFPLISFVVAITNSTRAGKKIIFIKNIQEVIDIESFNN